jgi:hypothetical protein
VSQLNDDDEVFDEVEHQPVHETTTQENQQQESEGRSANNVPNFHLMNVSQLKEELRKRKLSVNGRKDVLLQRLLAAPVTTSP